MVDYKVELKEKLKFKEGVGISTYDRGGRKKRTYQYGDVTPPKDTSQKEKRAERIAEQDRIKKAYDKRLAKEEEKRRTRRDKEYDLGKATTGKYEKGGAVIQETKGDFNTLQFLAAQQPGSRLVQNKTGEYVLIRSSGINFGSDANLLKLNKNLELEGRGIYTPTSQKNKEGGTDYFRQIKDTISGGEGKKPSEEKAEPFEKPKGVVSSKYNVEVGSNIVTAQHTLKKGYDYAITLNEGRQGYQKQRALSPREIAAGMSAGEIPLGFIGSKSAAGVLVDTEQKGQTYVDSAGNPIVTITGQSEGSEFGIFQSVKPGKAVPRQSAGDLFSGLFTKKETQQKELVKTKLEYYGPEKPLEESPSKSIERVLKRAAEPFYAAGIETFAPLVTKTLRLTGQKDQAEKITGELNTSYEKIASPPEGLTPFQNLMETGEPTTGRGLASDIMGYTTEALLLGGGAIGEIKNIGKVKNIPSLLSKLKKPPPPPPRPYQTNLQGSQFIVKNKLFKASEQIDMRITQIKLGKSKDTFMYKKPITLDTTPKSTPVKPAPNLIIPASKKGGFSRIPINLGRTLPDDTVKIEGTKILSGKKDINPFEGVKKPQPNAKTDIRDVQYRWGDWVVTPKRLGMAKEVYRQEGLISFKRPDPFKYERVAKPQPTTKPFDNLIIPASKKGGFSRIPINLGRTLPDDTVKIEGTKILSGKKDINPFEGVKKPQPEKIQIGGEKITPDELEKFLKKSGGKKLDWEFKSEQFKGSPGKYRMDSSKNFGPQLKLKEKIIPVKESKIDLKQDKPAQWVSTKIGLGVSSNVLLKRDGKTKIDTIVNKDMLTTFSKTPIPFLAATQKPEIKDVPIIVNISKARPPSIDNRQILTQKKRDIYKPGLRQPSKSKYRSTNRLRSSAIPMPSPNTPTNTAGVFPDQTPRQKQALEEVPPPRPPKIIPVWIPPPRVRTTKKEEPSPLISRKSWRGNVPEFDITGIYKKEIEITYLKKRRSKKKSSFDQMVKKIF